MTRSHTSWSGLTLPESRAGTSVQFRWLENSHHEVNGYKRIVGSEEARLRAGLRPPPKPCMQFSRTRLSRRHGTPRCNEKATNKWAIRFTRPVGSGLQYPRTMMYGFFAKRTDPPHHPYSADCPSLPSCLRLPPSPTHSSRRSLGHAAFAALEVIFGSPTTDRASLTTSLTLIGLLTPVATRRLDQSS